MLQKTAALSCAVIIFLFAGCFSDPGEPAVLSGVKHISFLSPEADTNAVPPDLDLLDPEIRLDLLPADPVRAGYRFTGWYSGAGGTGNRFSTNTPVSGNLCVYAGWQKLHTVSFEANGGDPVDPIIVPDGEMITNLPVPLYTGKGFVSWFSDSNCSWRWPVTNTITSNMTLYAKWSDSMYTLSYNGNGQSAGLAPSANTLGYNASVQLPGPASMTYYSNQIYYRLSGWSYSRDGATGSYVRGGSFVMPASNVTLYAQWSVIGGTGPGGGIVFYDRGVTNLAWQYMAVAPASTEWTGIQWGPTDEYILQLGGTAQYKAIGYGNYLTTIVADRLDERGFTNKAAQLCRNLVSGGKTDWFLPSFYEMEAVVSNSSIIPEISGKRYWSSSEVGNYPDAYMAGNVNDHTWAKTSTGYVRAVRRFK